MVLDPDGTVLVSVALSRQGLLDRAGWIDGDRLIVVYTLPATHVEVIGLDGTVHSSFQPAPGVTAGALAGDRLCLGTDAGIVTTGVDGSDPRPLELSIARVRCRCRERRSDRRSATGGHRAVYFRVRTADHAGAGGHAGRIALSELEVVASLTAANGGRVATYLHREGLVATQITSREFNQDTGGAKKAAEHGPVYITDRGRPAHVLLTYEAYEQLLGTAHIVDRLAEPAGVEDIEFTVPTSHEVAQPASFA